MTITRMVPATLAGHGKINDARLTWDETCPVQVFASFLTDGGTVTWLWSLELLRLGSASVFPHQIGRGDVQVTSDADSVVVFLNSPEGQATVSLDYAATREFLDAVCLANVHEAEAMDALVDAFLITLNEEAF